MYLKSIKLWLDEAGFHGMKYGMEKPDMAKDMCVKHEDLPQEAYLYMSVEDKQTMDKFLNYER